VSESKEKGKEDSKKAGKPDFPTLSCIDSVEAIGTQIGPYKVLSVLGEGGFGIVYLAEQKKPVRRQVALKVIKPGMDSRQVIARFEAEQQALALLDHPNIAHVFDAGTTEQGRPYFAMEYVKGTPVTEYCDNDRLTIEERLKLFLQICEAVQYAHQKGIIHRDIKPSNILVSVQGTKATPIIIDFGVAKALSQPLTDRTLFTEQGQLIGTPEYMSPEQVGMATHDIDTRSDIYSLGVLLYVLLTGALPFDSKTIRKGGIELIQRMICEEDPKRPSVRVSGISVEESTTLARQRKTDVRSLKSELRGDLDWITMKAMEKHRDRRYQTGYGLAEDIQRYLNHEPVIAAPPSTIYRLRKLCRKHRSKLFNAAMAAMLMVSIIVTAFIYYRSYSDRMKTLRSDHENQLRAIESLLYREASEKPVVLENADEDLVLSGRDSDVDYYHQYLADIVDKTEELLSSNHVGSRAALLRAVALLKLQDFNTARKILNGLVKIEEVECLAYLVLAKTYQDDPNRSAYNQQKAIEYQEKADLLVKASSRHHPDIFYYRAMMMQKPEEMIELLNKALDIDRAHCPSRTARAWVYYVLKEYDKMERDAEVLTVVQQENPTSYALHAVALRQLGEYDKSIQELNKAIEVVDTNDTRYAELYFERYQTYMMARDYERVREDAEEWIKRFDNRPHKYG